jgi:MATE family multidrug resistance protein
MFGNLGAPELGLDGAGVASALVNLFMFLALLFYVMQDKRLRRYRLSGRFWKIDWAAMREIARVGLPIAVTEVAEMGMFLTTSLMMGLLGAEALAAHGVTAQCYAVIFMIPVGLAQAGAVRVGRAVGAGEARGAALSGWTTIVLAGLIALVPVSLFWFAGEDIAGLILDPNEPGNAATVKLAASLLAVAAFFMITDAIQITSRGALQGMKDTQVPMAIALVTSWGLGFPAAILLGFVLGLGGQGIWAGLGVAMTAASLMLVWRFRNQSRALATSQGTRSM